MRLPAFKSSAPDSENVESTQLETMPSEPAGTMSVLMNATSALARARQVQDIYSVLLHAAFQLGAARPRAGLWRDEDATYSMWLRDPSGTVLPCGSAPASVYNAQLSSSDGCQTGNGLILLAGEEQRWGLLDVAGQISDLQALSALTILTQHAVLRLEALAPKSSVSTGGGYLSTVQRWWGEREMDRAIRLAVCDVSRVTGADSSALALYDPESAQPRILFSEDLIGAPEDHTPWKSIDDSRRNGEAVRYVLRTGEDLAFRWNPTTEALKAGILPSGPAEGSYLACPLTDGQRVLGVLDVYSRESRFFTVEHETLLRQSSLALGRLLGERYAAERHLRVVERHRAVCDLASDLAGDSDLRNLADIVVQRARAMWPQADIVYAMLPQVEGGLWSVAAIDSPRAEDRRHGWARAGEGFAGWVIHTRQPLIISAAADDPRRGSLDRGQNISAGMWAPMRRGEDLLGLLCVASTLENVDFDPEDLEMLERVAEQGAISLERARERHATQAAFWDAIEALSWAIDARDGYTHGHSRNVTEYSVAIAKALDLPFNEIQNLRAAALLHDIGKIGIPDHILNKPGQLTPDERQIMESHPEVGYQILMRAPSLQTLLPGIRYHHERPDGKGYPCRLTAERLPQAARILSVADAFDAMTSDRVYRKRMAVEKAGSILREGRGSQWDAEVVDVFLQIVETNATPRLQMLAAEDSGRVYLPSIGTDVFGG